MILSITTLLDPKLRALLLHECKAVTNSESQVEADSAADHIDMADYWTLLIACPLDPGNDSMHSYKF